MTGARFISPPSRRSSSPRLLSSHRASIRPFAGLRSFRRLSPLGTSPLGRPASPRARHFRALRHLDDAIESVEAARRIAYRSAPHRARSRGPRVPAPRAHGLRARRASSSASSRPLRERRTRGHPETRGRRAPRRESLSTSRALLATPRALRPVHAAHQSPSIAAPYVLHPLPVREPRPPTPSRVIASRLVEFRQVVVETAGRAGLSGRWWSRSRAERVSPGHE